MTTVLLLLLLLPVLSLAFMAEQEITMGC
ncbi:hypothetical protein NC651_013440 [Populus alba x Populus x berolinensis]|nr:hypothetical protein NC651_013440 [Populus alba x Populus x berolinensis]